MFMTGPNLGTSSGARACHSKFSFPPTTHAHFHLRFPYAHWPSVYTQSQWKGVRTPCALRARMCALPIELHIEIYGASLR